MSLVDDGLRSNEAAEARTEVMVGETAMPGRLHVISHPGRYGLGPDLPGSIYGVVDGMLVRIDPNTREIQSVIRRVDRILD
uniref:hypothetical protein n=1 Tax=uncultured Paracoccus sp. TaxID=189685 RepID=UPI00351A8736